MPTCLASLSSRTFALRFVDSDRGAFIWTVYPSLNSGGKRLVSA